MVTNNVGAAVHNTSCESVCVPSTDTLYVLVPAVLSVNVITLVDLPSAPLPVHAQVVPVNP